jgi:microcystin-dependent protein
MAQKSVQEILNKVYRDENGDIRVVQGTVQELLNLVYDVDNAALRVSSTGGGTTENFGVEHNADGTHADVTLSNSTAFTNEHNANGSHKTFDLDLSGNTNFTEQHTASGLHILKGFISGLDLSVKDADEFYIDGGAIDLSGVMYKVSSQLTKSLSTPSASTVYHVYIKPPASGDTLSASEIEYNTTAPTLDSDKGAGYHGSNTTWRWIGWLETDGSSNIDKIESVHAFNAKTVGDLEYYLVAESAPYGRVELDGSAISRTTYADLYQYGIKSFGVAFGDGDGSTTFDLPDLRGRFFRVWDHGAGIDPDAASRTDRGDTTTGDNVGTKQADDFASHNHDLKWTSDRYSLGSASGVGSTSSTLGSLIIDTGGNETRPKNINIAVYAKYIGRL